VPPAPTTAPAAAQTIAPTAAPAPTTAPAPAALPAPTAGPRPAAALTPPLPVKPADRTPATAGPDIATAVLGAVDGWRRAWVAGDLAGYLAAYVPDYRGDAASRAAWVKQRAARLKQSGAVEIQVRDARVQPLADGKARVHFRQKFQSRNHRDDSFKSLLLVYQKGKWLIQEERKRT
jgi:hypothetical protein